MSDTIALLKTAHVLSAAILFGTGIGIAFFCWFGYRRAMRTADLGALRAALRFTVMADAYFTAPAVVVQAGTGVRLMQLYEWPLVSAWSTAVWSLFILVGACWLPVVAMQIRLRREADEAASIDALPERFHRRFRAWFALGVPAFVAVVLIYYLMVAKPLAIAAL